jgi:hypothetical protein
MGGGLMQLVAYGAQDIYLTGNPQITFFKVVYRRHTNFSMEAIEQTFNGSVVKEGRSTATISRNGDLVHKMYIEVDATTTAGSTDNNYGTQMLSNVTLEVGGQQIDKHSGHWMETWLELTNPNELGQIFLVAVDGITAPGVVTTQGTLLQTMACCGGVNDAGAVAPGIIYVPLQFWFCRNPGLALPLIALQYHEVKVIIEWSSILNETAAKLWADYIYLDTDERRRFAQVSHEYLIEQVQEQSGSTSTSQDLNFNHPVKELIWTGAYANGAMTAHGAAMTDTNLFNLKLNGHDRFAGRPCRYFTRTQIYEHHSGFGGINNRDSISVYSFALKPEEHQPSGTCNFSRIDNAQLVATSGTQTPCPATGKIFAVNYNVLRIMSGMGGLAYSN